MLRAQEVLGVRADLRDRGEHPHRRFVRGDRGLGQLPYPDGFGHQDVLRGTGRERGFNQPLLGGRVQVGLPGCVGCGVAGLEQGQLGVHQLDETAHPRLSDRVRGDGGWNDRADARHGCGCRSGTRGGGGALAVPTGAYGVGRRLQRGHRKRQQRRGVPGEERRRVDGDAGHREPAEGGQQGPAAVRPVGGQGEQGERGAGLVLAGHPQQGVPAVDLHQEADPGVRHGPYGAGEADRGGVVPGPQLTYMVRLFAGEAADAGDEGPGRPGQRQGRDRLGHRLVGRGHEGEWKACETLSRTAATPSFAQCARSRSTASTLPLNTSWPLWL